MKYFNIIIKKINKNFKLTIFIFFLLYLIIGLFIYNDYGISFDEPYQRSIGLATFNFIFKGDNTLLENRIYKMYGPIFEIIPSAIEKIFNIYETYIIYNIRHLLVYLFFVAGVYFFYKLLLLIFNNWKIGLIGCSFLIITPRIFAHSFYNSKDAVFLSMFIISIYTFILYLQRRDLVILILHSLTSALLIDIRIMGIMIVLINFIIFFIDLLFFKKNNSNLLDIFIHIFVYIIFLICFTIIFWPALWNNPIKTFIETFNLMRTSFWNGTVLYFGEQFKAKDLPWHYLPVWIIISTPLMYIILFFIGIIFFIINSIKNKLFYYLNCKALFICFLWLFLPILSFYVFDSIIFDEWRHLFFIYPAILVFSVFGLIAIYKIIKVKIKNLNIKNFLTSLLILIILSNLFSTVIFMVRYHPYQNLYFNLLLGNDYKKIQKNFEMDYWGLSYRELIEYIIKKDNSNLIVLSTLNLPGFNNSYILPNNERQRLYYINNYKQANYFLTNYRGDYNDYSSFEEVYSVKFKNIKIASAFKIRPQYTEIIKANYENFSQIWRPMNQCDFKILNNIILINVKGDDPWFENKVPIKFIKKYPLIFKIIIILNDESEIRLFYASEGSEYVWENSFGIYLREAKNIIYFTVPYLKDINKFRIDPIDKNKNCYIEEISVYSLNE